MRGSLLHDERGGSASGSSGSGDESDGDGAKDAVDFTRQSMRTIQALIGHRLRTTPKTTTNGNDVQFGRQTGTLGGREERGGVGEREMSEEWSQYSTVYTHQRLAGSFTTTKTFKNTRTCLLIVS